MKESEINIKIQELEKKLNSKVKVLVKNKIKLKKQPIHLREYYLNEILRLKTQIGISTNTEIIKTDSITIKTKKEKYSKNKKLHKIITHKITLT